MHNIIVIFVIKSSTRKAIRNKMWQQQGCYCFLSQKQTVKLSIRCHVFAQSPPDRRPNDKYPVNTSHRSDLCQSVTLHCHLLVTVIYIQSVNSQICVYIHTYCAQYGDDGRTKHIQILGEQWMPCAKEIFVYHFGHECRRFVSPSL